MVEASGAIELLDERRQRDVSAPFVRPTANALERLPPLGPPRRHTTRKRLDDQHPATAPMVREQTTEKRVSLIACQLVHRVRSHDGTPFRHTCPYEIPDGRAAAKTEVAVGAASLVGGPGMPIDPENVGRARTRTRPGGARRPRATPQI